jgi:hypothetical protein
MAKTELPVLGSPQANGHGRTQPQLFDCSRCPAYCCSYAYIIVNRRDVRRLAKRFGLTVEAAEQRFTKIIPGYGRVLRHRQDTIFKSTCQFLHPTERRCTVYEHRPEVCRSYPETRRCRYYDFLQWERNHQDDESFIPLAR